MNRMTKLTAVVALAGGMALAAVNAPALGQPAAGPGGHDGGPGRPGHPAERGGPGRGGPERDRGFMPGAPGMGMPGPLGRLFAFRQDKALTPDEARRIVEGFLLWVGERDWRVVDVAEGPENTITFGIAAREGSAFMRFSMDRRTGQVRRVG